MAKPRKEVENLLAQARFDLKNAEKNISVAAYDVAAFLCHQSVEKGLKALFLQSRRQRPPPTHSLHELAQELSAPKSLVEALTLINADYVAARYPDAANGVPALLYTKKMAADRLAAARKIWDWLEKRF
ncbi:MAG: HEPN domain-containing protein [Planctomycetes bacterium]|nr:HEPN domain-containing protein [Planctomycetota bacterium]